MYFPDALFSLSDVGVSAAGGALRGDGCELGLGFVDQFVAGFCVAFRYRSWLCGAV